MVRMPTTHVGRGPAREAGAARGWLASAAVACILGGCAASSPASKTTPSGSQLAKGTAKAEVPKSGGQLKATLDPIVGRWTLDPAASRDGKGTPVEGTIGDTVVMARDGTIRVPMGDTNRRGTWKRIGDAVKVVLDPPPRATNALFTPSIGDTTMTLTGADGVVLVYRRDTVVGTGGNPS